MCTLSINHICNAPAEAEEPSVPLASGCDAPAEAEEPPVPLAPSPKLPIIPAVQVRQYSWHYYAKHDASDKRRKFVGTNKRTNPNSLLLPQQKPLVSSVHLMKVVRKIGQQERSRGEHLTVNVFKNHLSNGGKNVTSSSHPDRKVKGGNTSYSIMCNSGISVFNHKYQHINDKCKLKCSKMQEKETERECSFPGTPDDDGMVTSLNNDVTTLWSVDVNRLIARKRFVPRKRSLPYSVGNFKESLRACSRIVTFIAFLLAIVTNVLVGLIDIKRYERKSTVGTSASLSRSENSRGNNCYYSLSVLRKFLANILGSDKELWPCVIMNTIWKENKQFKRRKEELQKLRNTLMFRLVFALYWLRNLRFGNVTRETFRLQSGNVRKTFLAGKCLSAYLCLSADSWASCLYYMDIYTVNLELNKKFKRFCDYIYLNIYDIYRLWVSYDWASYPEALSVKTYTLVYFSSKSSLLMIKSHDKYQSIVLIGLAHVEKAYSKIRSISVHNRSYWRSCDLW